MTNKIQEMLDFQSHLSFFALAFRARQTSVSSRQSSPCPRRYRTPNGGCKLNQQPRPPAPPPNAQRRPAKNTFLSASECPKRYLRPDGTCGYRGPPPSSKDSMPVTPAPVIAAVTALPHLVKRLPRTPPEVLKLIPDGECIVEDSFLAILV